MTIHWSSTAYEGAHEGADEGRSPEPAGQPEKDALRKATLGRRPDLARTVVLGIEMELQLDAQGQLRATLPDSVLRDNAASRAEANARVVREARAKGRVGRGNSAAAQELNHDLAALIDQGVSGFAIDETFLVAGSADGLPLQSTIARLVTIRGRDERTAALHVEADPYLARFLAPGPRVMPLVGEFYQDGRPVTERAERSWGFFPARLVEATAVSKEDAAADDRGDARSGDRILTFVREPGAVFLPGQCAVYLAAPPEGKLELLQRGEEIAARGRGAVRARDGSPVFLVEGIGLEFVATGVSRYDGHIVRRDERQHRELDKLDVILSASCLIAPLGWDRVARAPYSGKKGIFLDLPDNAEETHGGRPLSLRLAAERDIQLASAGAELSEIHLDVFDLLPAEVAPDGTEARPRWEAAIRMIRVDTHGLDEFLPERLHGKDRGIKDNPSILLWRSLEAGSLAEFEERLPRYLSAVAENMGRNVNVLLSERLGIPAGEPASRFFDRVGLLKNTGRLVSLANRYECVPTLEACVEALCDVARTGGMCALVFLRSEAFRRFVAFAVRGELAGQAWHTLCRQLELQGGRFPIPLPRAVAIILGTWAAQQSLSDEGREISARALFRRALEDKELYDLVSESLDRRDLVNLSKRQETSTVIWNNPDGSTDRIAVQELANRLVLNAYLLRVVGDRNRNGHAASRESCLPLLRERKKR